MPRPTPTGHQERRAREPPALAPDQEAKLNRQGRTMTSNTSRVGHFTSENIVAVLQAISGSNGTYADIAEKARQQGSTAGEHTIAKWVTQGRKDLTARRDTAYARFAKQYDDRIKEHCGPEKNKHRELDQALAALQRACECGNDKQIATDGALADQCRTCQEIDDTGRQNNRRQNYNKGRG